MTQTDTLSADVQALVESIVLRPVKGDMLLLETGLVDSVLAIEIVLGVEMQFGVSVPPTEIAEHLVSVDVLAAFIADNR